MAVTPPAGEMERREAGGAPGAGAPFHTGRPKAELIRPWVVVRFGVALGDGDV
jgi:hypothetical protein